MARRLRRRYVSSYAEAQWRDDCGSALTRLMQKRCGATPVEALRGDICPRAMARRLRKRYDASSTEALYRVVCGSALARGLQKRSGETPA